MSNLSERDLFALVYDLLQYDFNEDDEDVQGTWEFERTGNTITIIYNPFDDSPYPPERMTYRVRRIDDRGTVEES